MPALQANTGTFLTTEDWFPNFTPPVFGIAALAYGTVVSSLIALCPRGPGGDRGGAVHPPLRPAPARGRLGYVIDLLAAVPSVVYGLWGLLFLNGGDQGPLGVPGRWLGWIPMFVHGRLLRPRCSWPAWCSRS